MTNTSSVNTERSLSQISVFENSEFGEIRSLIIDNEPWFVGKDVAYALGYKDTSDALKKHIDEDDKLGRQIADSGQNRMTYLINESGLYSLILSSKLPKAKEFKRWVTSEVLPSIRKTGSYQIVPQTAIINPVEEKRVGLERAKYLGMVADRYEGKSTTYRQILDAYAVKEIVGDFVLPLPEATRKSYSAGEIGKILGISANMVGSVAIKNNLKTDEFGLWVHDKSRYSNKEVDTFRYYDNVIPEIKRIIEAGN